MKTMLPWIYTKKEGIYVLVKISLFFGTVRMNDSPAWGFSEGLTSPHRNKNQLVMKYYRAPRIWQALVNMIRKFWAP
jgi:hypothetical protein